MRSEDSEIQSFPTELAVRVFPLIMTVALLQQHVRNLSQIDFCLETRGLSEIVV